jgi:hypothetical protein
MYNVITFLRVCKILALLRQGSVSGESAKMCVGKEAEQN